MNKAEPILVLGVQQAEITPPIPIMYMWYLDDSKHYSIACKPFWLSLNIKLVLKMSINQVSIVNLYKILNTKGQKFKE